MSSGTRFYRRAIAIYVGTIVLPVGVLLWLGLQSFERQRQSLLTLTAEKLAAAVESEATVAAASAFANHAEPIAKYYFLIQNGLVTEPALNAPPPREAPPEFLEAERQELELN